MAMLEEAGEEAPGLDDLNTAQVCACVSSAMSFHTVPSAIWTYDRLARCAVPSPYGRSVPLAASSQRSWGRISSSWTVSLR